MLFAGQRVSNLTAQQKTGEKVLFVTLGEKISLFAKTLLRRDEELLQGRRKRKKERKSKEVRFTPMTGPAVSEKGICTPSVNYRKATFTSRVWLAWNRYTTPDPPNGK